MAIESKDLLVWIKAMSRSSNLPLDASEVHDSLSAAQAYVSTPTAYGGQTIKALVDGKYKKYTIQPSESGYVLEEDGAISSSDLKQYVQIVESLPTSGQEEGILYICGTTGSIWTGTVWKTVFEEVSSEVAELTSRIDNLESSVDEKAPLENPTFIGTATINGDEIATREYTEGLVANIVNCAPGIVDASNPLPTTNYKAGQTFRVASSGTYAGQDCEVGDLVIVITNYNEETASDADFMVIQANIDGAVTSSTDASTVGEIVIFDAVTGKVIKGSGVTISSLNDVIAKAHDHENETVLDSYDKTQAELLSAASTDAQGKIDTYKLAVDAALEGKADVTHTHDDRYYTETEVDNFLSPIIENLNTKIDSSTVDTKIATAKEEITTAYEMAIANRVGAIPEDTDLKTYIDNAVGSGGTSSAEAIAQAKQEAINTSKDYTDEQINTALSVTEF